jgi:hypothetical protein
MGDGCFAFFILFIYFFYLFFNGIATVTKSVPFLLVRFKFHDTQIYILYQLLKLTQELKQQLLINDRDFTRYNINRRL